MGRSRHGKFQWECRCDCGALTISLAAELRGGYKKSCGCLGRDGHGSRRHGHKPVTGPSRAYLAWSNMKRRCRNPNFANYGGRGIAYDPRWESFDAFLDDMGAPPQGASLDRINNDGPYSVINCRWATRREQNANRRNTLIIEHAGRRQTLGDWSRETGVRYMTLLSRLNRGWPVERVLQEATP